MTVVGELQIPQDKVATVLQITLTPLPPLKPEVVTIEIKHPITDVKAIAGAVVVK